MFSAQQCVEKAFKAILELHNQRIPKTHSTLKLFDLVKDYLAINIDIDMLIELDRPYIDARYPTDLGLLPEGKPTIEDAKRFYKFCKNIL